MRVIIRLSALVVVFFSIQAFADVFQRGDVVIYRVGDGSAGLTSAASPVFIDEYKTDGTFVQSIPLPIAVSGSNKRLTATGNDKSEGLLTISADGQYIVVTGYDADVNTATVAGTASATTARVIGRVKISDGSVDTSTTVTDGFDTGHIRGATSTDGSSFWATGSGGTGTSGGIRYVNFGTAGSTQLSTTVTDLRAGNIFGSKLYVSSAATGFRLATVGSGLPTTSGQTITSLPGFPTTPEPSSPYQFFFADLSTAVAGVDTLYVADDTGRAIRKYSLVGGNWTANGSVPLLFVQGLTGTVLGNLVTLYVSQGNGGSLVIVSDSSGYNATMTSPAPLSLANPPANTLFRGLAVVGGQPTNPSGTGSGNPGTVHAGETTTLTVTVAPGGAPFSTGLAVAADLTSIGGVGYQTFVDGGTLNGNEIFTFDALVQAGTAAGPKTFPVSITDAQARSATTSIDLTVLPGLPTLSIQLDSPATRDVLFSGTVTARDNTKNVVTDYTGTVHFTSTSDPQDTLPADYTFTAGDAGVHTFTNAFRLHAIGLQSITATDVANAAIVGTGATQVSCPTISIAATNDGSCEGAIVHLDVTLVTGATYQWSGPNGFSSTLRNPTIDQATPAASGQYTVGVNADGCFYSAQTVVTVKPLPATPTPTNGGPYLTDATIDLFANAVADAYQWTGPNGFTSADQNPVIANALLANAGTYSLTITVNGCTSAAGTTDVTVTQANRPPVLGHIGNRVVAAGSTLAFTISATDADNDTLTYSADPLPAGATFDADTQTFSWTPTSAQTGNHSITFSVDDGNGGTASEQITIGVSPVAPASVSAHFVGVGVTVQWSASSGAAQYRILRRDIAGLLHIIATVDPTPLSYTDLTAPANSASQYSVEATTDGDDSASVAYAAVSTVPFTNDPLSVNSTPLKAEHIYQLRQAINKLRELAGPQFGDYAFEDDVLEQMPARTVHLDQMRTAYDDIRATLNLPTFSFTDPSPLPQDKILIRAAHLQELRVAVH